MGKYYLLCLSIILGLTVFNCNKSNSNAAATSDKGKKQDGEKTELAEEREKMTPAQIDSVNAAKNKSNVEGKFSNAQSAPSTQTPVLDTTATQGVQTGENQEFDPNALNQDNRPEITFNTTAIDFGTIQAGDQIKEQFYFTNTGGSPLKIRRVETSCGCVNSEYPYREVQPGDGSYVGAVFNSKDKSGNVEYTLTVHSNIGPQKIKLKLKGIVN